MATMTIGISDGTTSEPLARYHCPACRSLTMAPLGQDSVSCSACGVLITDEKAFVELYSDFVEYQLSPAASLDARDRDYEAVDSEIFSMMVNFESERLCRRGG